MTVKREAVVRCETQDGEERVHIPEHYCDVCEPRTFDGPFKSAGRSVRNSHGKNVAYAAEGVSPHRLSSFMNRAYSLQMSEEKYRAENKVLKEKIGEVVGPIKDLMFSDGDDELTPLEAYALEVLTE